MTRHAGEAANSRGDHYSFIAQGQRQPDNDQVNFTQHLTDL
jgi:hypothetical protein